MNEHDNHELNSSARATGRALREHFEATARDFTPLPLGLELWETGREERRRSRLQVVAAAVLVVAALATTFGLNTQSEIVPSEVPRGGALPTEIHLPDWEVVEHEEEAGRIAENDRALGRASVAVTLDDDVAVVVGADDGQHHLLRLHDLAFPPPEGQVALSPDGWRLAWPYRSPEGTSGGTSVLDLRTGGVRQHPGLGADGQMITPQLFQWSADSTHLLWRGTTWNAAATEDEQSWMGVLTPDQLDGARPARATSTMSSVHDSPDSGWAALTSSGVVMVAGNETLETWTFDARGALAPSSVRDLTGSGFVAGLAMVEPDDTAVILVEHFNEGDVDGDGKDTLGLTETPIATQDAVALEPTATPLALPHTNFSQPAHLAITPAGAAVLLTNDGESIRLHRMAQDGTQRVVTRTGGGLATDISFAVDLTDAAPIDFPAPAWDRDTTPQRVLLGMLGGAFVLWLLWVLRTRPVTLSVAAAHRLRGVGKFVVTATLVLGFLMTAQPWLPQKRVHAPGAGALPWQVTGPHDTYPGAPHAQDDFAVGAAGAMWAPDTGAAVVVSADEGRHALLNLASGDILHFAFAQSQTWAALSPDGAVLAASWAKEQGTTDGTQAGISLTDLRSGSVRTLSLRGPGDRPIRVDDLSFSSDGSHLVWYGDEASEWTEHSVAFGGKARVVGITAVGNLDQTSWRVEAGTGAHALAVSDDGTGHLLLGRRHFTFDLAAPDLPLTGRRVTDQRLEWSGAALTPTGSALVVGLNGTNDGSREATGLRRLDVSVPDSVVSIEPGAVHDQTRVLGHSPEGRLVVAILDERSSTGQSIRVIRLEDGGEATLTHFPRLGLGTVAVALSLTDGSSVGFREPQWPSDERRAAAITLGLLSLLALGLWLRRFARGALARAGRREADGTIDHLQP